MTQAACPDPIRRRAILRAAIWSDHPLVAEQRERYLKPLGLAGYQGYLQGRRRIVRRLNKRRDPELDRLLVVAMIAHGEEIGATRKPVG